MIWKPLFIVPSFDFNECVEMNSNTLIRSFIVLVFIFPISLGLIISQGNCEETSVRLINGELELERISPLDTSPAIMRLSIPFDGGEPIIRNLSYRISENNWIDLSNWEESCTGDDHLATITFQVDLDWGIMETIFVRVVDLMGSSSTVGCPIILSRPPSVNIIRPLDNNEISSPGEYTFEASVSDPDGQDVHCLWKIDNEAMTEGRVFTTFLDEGSHSISIEVSDGQWTTVEVEDIEIEITDQKESNGSIDIVWILSLSFLSIVVISLFLFILFAFNSVYRSKWIQRSESRMEIELGSTQGSIDCDICLKTMKKDQTSTNCRCGAVFHKGCGRSEGVCPECGREILI
jgi:hypothetical protein